MVSISSQEAFHAQSRARGCRALASPRNLAIHAGWARHARRQGRGACKIASHMETRPLLEQLRFAELAISLSALFGITAAFFPVSAAHGRRVDSSARPTMTRAIAADFDRDGRTGRTLLPLHYSSAPETTMIAEWHFNECQGGGWESHDRTVFDATEYFHVDDFSNNGRLDIRAPNTAGGRQVSMVRRAPWSIGRAPLQLSNASRLWQQLAAGLLYHRMP